MKSATLSEPPRREAAAAKAAPAGPADPAAPAKARRPAAGGPTQARLAVSRSAAYAYALDLDAGSSLTTTNGAVQVGVDSQVQAVVIVEKLQTAQLQCLHYLYCKLQKRRLIQ